MNRRIIYSGGVLLTSALTMLALASTGLASEQFPPGDYSLTVPGVGNLGFSVDEAGAVVVGAIPDGFTLVVDEEDDENELEALLSNDLISVKLEIEDGEIEVGLEDGLAPGSYQITLADGNTIVVEVAEDGTATVTDLPAGYNLIDGEDGEILLAAPDGTILKVEFGDDEFELKAVDDEAEDEAEDESDDESDDESEDESEDEADDDDADEDDDEQNDDEEDEDDEDEDEDDEDEDEDDDD